MVEDRIDEEKVNEEKQPEEMTVEEYSLPGNNHPEGKAGKRDNEDNDDNEGNRDASAGREINLAETEKLKEELKEAQERL